MCFSAEASFIAGVSLSLASIVTVRAAKHKNQLPFALIPLFFGIQQLIEGVVWLSFGLDSPMLNMIMTSLYTFFYRVFWPIYTPFAIWMLEPSLKRKKILFWFILMGVVAGAHYIYIALNSPITSHVVNHSIVYGTPYFEVPFWFLFFILYFLATIASCFFSSYRTVRMLGLLLFFAIAVAYIFYALSFVSVWCFFAAVVSFIVYLHFRYPNVVPELNQTVS